MPYIGNQPGTGVRSRFIYTATASQTTFSGADDNSKTLKYADSDYIDVYLNGVCLVPGTDYTASTKTSVVLTQAASLNDTLEVVAYDIATIADTVSKADGGNFVKTVSFSEDVLIGKTEAETTISGATPALQVTGAGFDAAAAITRREANAFGASMVLAKSRNTDSNSFTIVQDDDVLGSVIFIGDDGTNLDTYGAAITASVDGTPGANDLPARLTFSTTADGAASPTEHMRIANNGKVGIGSNTAASHTFSVNKAEAGTIGTFYDTGSNGGQLYSVDPVMAVSRTSNGSTSHNGPLFMVGRDNSETATFNIDASIFEAGSDEVVVNESGGDIDFRVESDSNTNAFKVDAAGSGTIMVGGTSVFNYGQSSGNGTLGYAIDNGSSYGSLMLSNNADRGWALCYANKFAYSSGDDRRIFALNINGGAVGNIQTNSAGTQIEFNATSDRRIKENITDLTNGIDKVKQLRPRAFEWITEEDKTFPAYGFVADEADGILPEWVTGEANAVDEDNKPIYQTMDYSKAVPVLTAALKEAIAKIETLEAENTAIKARLDALEAE